MSTDSKAMSPEEFNSLFGQIIATVDESKLSSLPSLMKRAVRKIRNKERKASMNASRKRIQSQRSAGLLPTRTREMRIKEKRDHKNRAELESGKLSKWQYWYSQYLLTPEWERIRVLILDRDLHKCRCCNQRATQVHHRSYSPDVMVGKDLNQLVAICDNCHNKIHKDGSVDRKLKDVDAVLLSIILVRPPQ